jgi:hypothetical protein
MAYSVGRASKIKINGEERWFSEANENGDCTATINVTAPAASNTQITAGRRSFPETFKILIDNIAHIFTNKLDRLITRPTAGTFTKVSINTEGQVTSGTTLAASDIPSLDAGKITSGTLPVIYGGTGRTSLTAYGVQYAASTTAEASTAAGAVNTVLHGNGSAAPSFSNIATADIADSAITSAKINDLAVTEAKLAANAVTSGKIADGAIMNADINASAAIAISKLATPGSIRANLGSTTAANPLAGNIGVTGTLPVANGGTGAINLSGIVRGNGTGAFTAGALTAAEIRAGIDLGGNKGSTPTYFATYSGSTYGYSSLIDAKTALGITLVSKTADGLAPKLPNETSTTKYLRQDGTWQVPTVGGTLTDDAIGSALSAITTGITDIVVYKGTKIGWATVADARTAIVPATTVTDSTMGYTKLNLHRDASGNLYVLIKATKGSAKTLSTATGDNVVTGLETL